MRFAFERSNFVGPLLVLFSGPLPSQAKGSTEGTRREERSRTRTDGGATGGAGATTERLRLPRQSRPLVVPAVKARRGGVTQQRGKAILCQSIQGPSGGRRPHSLCIEQHSRPRHPQGASVALARACHPREQSLPSLMQSMAAGASEAGLAQTSTDGARLGGQE